MSQIKVVISGFGNVGRGVVESIKRNSDMKLVGILSRNPDRVRREVSDVAVLNVNDTDTWLKEFAPDVVILCGGSKNDLPEWGPKMAKLVNTVDSFDNHSRVPEYFAEMDKAALESGHVSVISTGWDPGIFSLERVLAGAFIPGARAYGFYGLGEKGGLSMGHSDALRTIKGVKDARQYTHAIPEAIDEIRAGKNPQFQPGDMHTRECFVVAEEGADKDEIVKTIKEMPGYFAPYKTNVTFVSQEELDSKYAGVPHDGLAIAAGTTGNGNSARVEYRCVWGSNPEATANVLVAHARAVARLAKEGKSGAMTILDIPASYFTSLDRAELLKHWI
ncbi:MAG: diaminopimelate dehydrogenase [Lentisphaeria bacterium]|nr:diaminopimelate dehydrogenase [Lentisphaeria bacterium]